MKDMEFRIADDVGLCRKSDSGYESCMIGNVWGFDGFACGAFLGFESSKPITREEALECLINECDVAPENAEAELEKPGLSIEETIQNLVDHGYTVKDARIAIGYKE